MLVGEMTRQKREILHRLTFDSTVWRWATATENGTNIAMSLNKWGLPDYQIWKHPYWVCWNSDGSRHLLIGRTSYNIPVCILDTGVCHWRNSSVQQQTEKNLQQNGTPFHNTVVSKKLLRNQNNKLPDQSPMKTRNWSHQAGINSKYL